MKNDPGAYRDLVGAAAAGGLCLALLCLAAAAMGGVILAELAVAWETLPLANVIVSCAAVLGMCVVSCACLSWALRARQVVISHDKCTPSYGYHCPFFADVDHFCCQLHDPDYVAIVARPKKDVVDEDDRGTGYDKRGVLPVVVGPPAAEERVCGMGGESD